MSAGAKLARALVAMAEAAGCRVRVISTSERPWASATFVGARHALTIETTPCPALSAWLADLPEAAFALPGHVVADIAIAQGDDGVRVEALTLVDA